MTSARKVGEDFQRENMISAGSGKWPGFKDTDGEGGTPQKEGGIATRKGGGKGQRVFQDSVLKSGKC